MAYDINIEQKWQNIWDENHAFKVSNNPDNPYYVLEMFPYPSGRIHMGHLRNYALGDVVARFKQQQGYDVLHPIGWDAFGLPAENAAIEKNTHPRTWTFENIDVMREQLKSIGLSYDWDREFATCSPNYYKFEQEIFLKFLENDIAYRKEAVVNWDPVDKTVLANEQVIDGKGWRSGAEIERKTLNQWFLRITDFAQDLLDGLDSLTGWPEKVRLMQEKWIGKSHGAEIEFEIAESDKTLRVYTTRPETIFGASFCAIAANHPLSLELAENNTELQDFIKACEAMGTSAKTIEQAEKRGFDTGLRAQHPFDNTKTLPIYVANFVLMDYGLGALFACPAHDQRDLDFARAYDLPVTLVVQPKDQKDFVIENEAYGGDGVMVNSTFLDGMNSVDAKNAIIKRLEQDNKGKRTTNYRLRDWGISRQRYWGCPIPIIYCDDCGAVPVPTSQLPVTLPEDVDFSKEYKGNPLDAHPIWKNTKCPKCSKDAVRETDTFDTFFESSWYFLRFASQPQDKPFNKDDLLSVDNYIGGIEHAILHLLYARFFTRALNKCGYTDIKEPFVNLMTQGMVCHISYKDEAGKWLFPDQVTKKDGDFIHADTGKPVTVGRIEKMSKSKKNVVDPELIIRNYGADTARLFMLSDSPPERDLEWSDEGIQAAHKYINKIWQMASVAEKYDGELGDNKDLRSLIHKTIDNVTQDLENFHFNKAVARIRELTNKLEKTKPSVELDEGIKAILQLFNPMIPHITEELWNNLGYETPIFQTSWPKADPELLKEDKVTIAVQINGKLKGTIEMAKDASNDETQEAALALDAIKNALNNPPKKVIVVPNRIVNIVV